MTDQARSLLGSLGYFLLIVVPVLAYLRKRAETNQRIVRDTFVLWILWYLPYAPVHEGCHFVAGSLAGMHLKSHQFIPPFGGEISSTATSPGSRANYGRCC